MTKFIWDRRTLGEVVMDLCRQKANRGSVVDLRFSLSGEPYKVELKIDDEVFVLSPWVDLAGVTKRERRGEMETLLLGTNGVGEMVRDWCRALDRVFHVVEF